MTLDPPTPTIPGRLGKFIAVVVLAYPIVSGFVQFRVDSHRDSLNLNLEKQKIALSAASDERNNMLAAQTQDENNRLAVNKLFLDHYQSASASEQRRTIDILVTLYPVQFVSVAKIFNNAASTPQVSQDVQTAASAAVATGKIQSASPRVLSTKTSDVGILESRAFTYLANGNLVNARRLFLQAYGIFPTYHNVDEISHLVLTDSALKAYSKANASARSSQLKSIYRVVLQSYSWGIPPALLARLHAEAD